MEQNDEILFNEKQQRYTVFPIIYNDIWEAYIKQRQCFWTPHEIDFQQDQKDWNRLSKDEKHFIEYVLAFFAGSDGIVIENLVQNFTSKIKIVEAKAFYGIQEAIEMIHQETYSMLIDTYVQDKDHKEFLFNGIETIDCIKQKALWAQRWIQQGTFQERLIAFAIVEGIFFSGSFCSIYWLKQRGLMPGLCSANQLISRDEGLHQDFACLLYTKYIKNKLSQDVIQQMVREAVEIEKNFICEAIPCKFIGMNQDHMCQYIEYVSDKLLKQIQCKPIWNSANPFPWMNLISMENKTNFFENRVTEYQKSSTGKEEFEVDIDQDF